MSDAAKRGRPYKRDVNARNDEESTNDQPAEKSLKREEESVPSTQDVQLPQETKKEKSEPVLKNDALKEQIDRLTKERAELQARSGMTQQSASELLDRMEKMGEISFMDLPDDIHIRFFKDLDFPSRLKLRLNKRLDGLHLCVQNELFGIRLSSLNHYGLKLCKSAKDFSISPSRQYHDFDQLAQGLNPLSLNTTVSDILIDIDTNEHTDRIIEGFSNFKSDELRIYLSQLLLSPLNLSILLNFAQNTRHLYLTYINTSAQDLCTLRKIILEGDCKLKKFSMNLNEGMEKAFVKECFGVTIEEIEQLGEGIWTKIFRTTDESIEFYGDDSFSYSHFENELETSISRFNIIIYKRADIVKDVKKRIQLNYPYSYYQQ